MGGLNKSSGQEPAEQSHMATGQRVWPSKRADESSVEEVKNAYERLKKTAKIEISD
jgi:hypothetical protein